MKPEGIVNWYWCCVWCTSSGETLQVSPKRLLLA